ncbi:MAG: tRNA-uridine aminocarboxypropyltransferase [Bacteriovoracaceae bacterium]
MKSENDKVMNLCLNCRRRLRTCVCEYLRPFDTESRFIILMHPMEFKKEKVGTGRFSHLILKNSLCFVDISFDQNKEFLAALNDPQYQSFVLYPGVDTINLSSPAVPEALLGKKNQFIVIDGTWPCAKKMMKLSKCLHDLPRVSFQTERISEFKIKHQPLPGCLSTVESIHQVLKDLNRFGIENNLDAEDNLIEVFRKTIDMQIQLAQDPERQGYRRKSFSMPENRKISKKWSDRLLFFKGNS